MSTSKQKKSSVKWGKGYVTKSDAQRLNQLTNTYENLSENAKNLFVQSIYSTDDYYKPKSNWTIEERNVVRLMWNRCNHDYITEVFQCSYLSLLNIAEVLGLHPDELDGRPMDEQDGENMLAMLNSGESVEDVAKTYGLEYDYFESHIITHDMDERLNNMKQDDLFGE